MKKNKLLICYRPVAVEEDSGDDPSAVDRYRSVIPLRKSKSFTFTEFPDNNNNNSMITRKKETSRSISGSFEAAVLALSFRKHSNGKVHDHGTTDLRRNRFASKSSRFSSEDNGRWNPRIKESSSEASLTTLGSSLSGPEEEKQRIEKKNRVETDSSSSSKSAVYLILVISLFMTVFYGRIYSVAVTSSFIFCVLCRRKKIEDIAGGGGSDSEIVKREISPNENERSYIEVGNPPEGISINDVNFLLVTKSLSRGSS